jgi:hypothetical protein
MVSLKRITGAARLLLGAVAVAAFAAPQRTPALHISNLK